jgi:hypothetical protein
MISKCVFSLSENLRDPNSPEHAVLGSCAILTSKTVLRHLSTVVIRDHICSKKILESKFFLIYLLAFQDSKSFSSFILGILLR